MVKVKSGAIEKNITEGALDWFLMAGWKVIEEEEGKDESDTKEIVTTQMFDKEV